MITEYEHRVKKEVTKRKVKSDAAEYLESLKMLAEAEAERIIGAVQIVGELHFVIKWKDIVAPSLVVAKEANIKWPQIVIDFYESRVL